MNKRTFLKHLGKHKGKFKICFDGQIRTKTSYLTNWGYAKNLCPIEMVDLSKRQDIISEELFAIPQWKINLGLVGDLEIFIIDAADNNNIENKMTASLRKSMLKVLGLEEPNES
ncbi:hypothetical protein C4577_02990 [Candidatus Parcubacteria bacterium]|nr:MAG: hypothetical protein C4577_02990 [Candidatus Parcubacteria bacterium]